MYLLPVQSVWWRHVEKQHQNIPDPSLTYGWEAATYGRGRHRKAHSSRGWQATEVRAAAAADATIRPSEVPRGPSRSSPAAWCAGLRSSGACGERDRGGSTTLCGGGARSCPTAHSGRVAATGAARRVTGGLDTVRCVGEGLRPCSAVGCRVQPCNHPLPPPFPHRRRPLAIVLTILASPQR